MCNQHDLLVEKGKFEPVWFFFFLTKNNLNYFKIDINRMC
jgi:hypothetical protein